jgi:TolB-like protein
MTPTATAAVRATRKSRPRWLGQAVAAAVVFLAVAGGAIWYKGRGAQTETPTPHLQRLAVLPLQNLSGDATQDGMVAGLHDALITELTQKSGLTVISRTSVMRYAHSDKSLGDIARELNVDAVLEGSVQHSGTRTIINANLLEGATERSLWAQSYERDTKDPLEMQGEVVRTMTQDIMAKVGAAAGVAAAKGKN